MDDLLIKKYVDYNKARSTLKMLWGSGILELEICNAALIGIAKELGITNPILI